jgi:molybdopterin adenylyltransferase
VPDLGLPSLQTGWIGVTSPVHFTQRLIADEQAEIEATLSQLVDENCHLFLTTGGWPRPPRRHPEATLAVADKVMPAW